MLYFDSLNDVWSSPDGSNWTQVDAAADGSTLLSYQRGCSLAMGRERKSGVMGGRDEAANELNYVWSSDNGQTWGKGTGLTLSVTNASTVEYKGRLWSLGVLGTVQRSS